MGKQEKRVLTLDRYEHSVVVNALNEMRNDLLEEERPTDIVDEVLLKVIDAPAKKVCYQRRRWLRADQVRFGAGAVYQPLSQRYRALPLDDDAPR